MASRTAVTENRRKAKHRAMGAKRKAANRNKGTTPKFAIHEDGAPKATKAAAPKAAKAPAAKKAPAKKAATKKAAAK
ncbi:hypothetical protein [Peredibacter starrii]|uniref:Uncharacterized protein n=1 Tax=Peredibacter starrii TaxID=28202 RepID=A0AAX4HMX1_9BACT|nr:hypothetical protein [Peredibacter starrii]WPU64239.1 hypothetical protein SOO65_16215 [Peredibacter starrii]